jgi:hypothetical protein
VSRAIAPASSCGDATGNFVRYGSDFGGCGSEFNELRADGIDDSLAVFGRPPLENIARGFGLRGHAIRDVSVIPKAVCRLRRAGRKRNLEHPDLGQGHGTDHPPDHQARARQYVSIFYQVGLLVACTSILRAASDS